jgi:flagellum-specific peptidoglycan hydrolase FlgJ
MSNSESRGIKRKHAIDTHIGHHYCSTSDAGELHSHSRTHDSDHQTSKKVKKKHSKKKQKKKNKKQQNPKHRANTQVSSRKRVKFDSDIINRNNHHGNHADSQSESENDSDSNHTGTETRLQDESMMNIQGIFQGDALYLVDMNSGVAYSSERDAADQLVSIGRWDASAKNVVVTNCKADEKSCDATKEKEAAADTHSKKEKQKTKTKKKKTNKKKKNKKKKNKTDSEDAPDATEENDKNNAEIDSSGPLEHPFETDADDHCETSLEAYEDIAPVLDAIAKKLGKTRAELRIYDPYFCAGTVVKNLGSLGFSNVYNKCQDFYKVLEEKRVPEFDVLLTNPPYSGDHIERIVRLCFGQFSDKPWLLLVPNFVYTKPYWKEMLSHQHWRSQPCFLTPSSRYRYNAPATVRKSKEGRRTAPFVSFWFIGATTMIRQTNRHEPFMQRIVYESRRLPNNIKSSYDRTRKKLRKKQRDKLKKQNQQR